jgi:hypothetical protein
MAFLFDSLCAASLFVATILSWGMAANMQSGARVNLRFAAMMLAAFSAAPTLPNSDLAFDVALLTPSFAAAATILALSFPRRPPVWLSCLVLIAGLSAGLLAALQVMPVLALGYQVGAALAFFAWAMSRFGEKPHAAIMVSLSAMSLLFGAMAVMNASLGAAMLFFAAFLLLATRASQAAVVDQRQRGRLIVGGERV